MMWRIAILGAAGLALCGCRVDPNVPILERELRLQEDKIYQLEGQLAEHRAALEACRRQAGCADGTCALPAGTAAPARGPLLAPADAAEPAVPQPPVVELPSQPQTQIPESLRSKTAPPAVEPPAAKPDKPKPESGATSSASTPRRIKAVPAAAPIESAAEDPPAAAHEPARPLSTGPVERVVLNPALSGGLNVDGKPGDEGLALLIEPQDAQGRAVERPAPICVVVLDRQATGQAARVARWDFSSEQVAKKFRHTSVGSGIYLELPWPTAAPAHSELQAFVRYVPADGRHLEAEMPLAIELPGQPKQWTAAPPGSKQPPATAAQRAPAPAAPPPPAAAEAIQAPPPQAPSTPPAARRQASRPVWSPTR